MDVVCRTELDEAPNYIINSLLAKHVLNQNHYFDVNLFTYAARPMQPIEKYRYFTEYFCADYKKHCFLE